MHVGEEEETKENEEKGVMEKKIYEDVRKAGK